MKKLKELFNKLFRKKNDETEVSKLGELPALIVHPFDLLQTLGIVIAYKTAKPVQICSDDILQFALYGTEKDEFIGTFFCVEREGRYFGNIIGSSDIITCGKNAFRFEETDKIIYPMGGNYTLSAIFKSPEIFPAAFLKKDVVVHKFIEENTITQAFDYCLSFLD